MEFIAIFEAIFMLCYPDVVNLGLNPLDAYVALAIAGGLYVVLYAFKAVGLWTMAKKQGKNRLLWCAFVPFASTYLVGELAGELKFGKTKIKHVGLYAMLGELINFLCFAFVYGYMVYAFKHDLVELYSLTNTAGELTGLVDWRFTAAVPEGLFRAVQIVNVLTGYFLSLIVLVLFVFRNIAFFRRYSPASYIWMVVLCALIPVAEPFLIFAYRNRTPVDYEKYMQARMEQIRRMQQAQYGPYGNPYGRPYSNPYGQDPYRPSPNGQGRPNEQPDDPFGEFSSGSNKANDSNGSRASSGGGDDPFGEFTGSNGQNGSGGQNGTKE